MPKIRSEPKTERSEIALCDCPGCSVLPTAETGKTTFNYASVTYTVCSSECAKVYRKKLHGNQIRRNWEKRKKRDRKAAAKAAKRDGLTEQSPRWHV